MCGWMGGAWLSGAVAACQAHNLKVPGSKLGFTTLSLFWLSPLPVRVANEGLLGSPTKNITILVVTVAGQGDNPSHH